MSSKSKQLEALRKVRNSKNNGNEIKFYDRTIDKELFKHYDPSTVSLVAKTAADFYVSNCTKIWKASEYCKDESEVKNLTNFIKETVACVVENCMHTGVLPKLTVSKFEKGLFTKDPILTNATLFLGVISATNREVFKEFQLNIKYARLTREYLDEDYYPLALALFDYLLELKDYSEYSQLKAEQLCTEYLELGSNAFDHTIALCRQAHDFNEFPSIKVLKEATRDLLSMGYYFSANLRCRATPGSLSFYDAVSMYSEFDYKEAYSGIQSTNSEELLGLAPTENKRKTYISSVDVLNSSYSDCSVPMNQMIMVCAAPNTGKSLFLEQEAITLAKQDYKVHLLVLGDLTETALVNRLNALASNLSLSECSVHPERAMWINNSNFWKNLKITILPSNQITVEEYVNACTDDGEFSDFDAYIVDYDANFKIGSGEGDSGKGSLYENGRSIYDSLTRIVAEQKLVVIASQPKVGYYNKDEIPMLGIAESSGKIQVVDTILTIGKYDSAYKPARFGKMIVQKNRHGVRGNKSHWVSTPSGRFVTITEGDYESLCEGRFPNEWIANTEFVEGLFLTYQEQRLKLIMQNADKYVPNGSSLVNDYVKSKKEPSEVESLGQYKVEDITNEMKDIMNKVMKSVESGADSFIPTSGESLNNMFDTNSVLPSVSDDVRELAKKYNRSELLNSISKYDILKSCRDNISTTKFHEYLMKLDYKDRIKEVYRMARDFNTNFEISYTYMVTKSSSEGEPLDNSVYLSKYYTSWIKEEENKLNYFLKTGNIINTEGKEELLEGTSYLYKRYCTPPDSYSEEDDPITEVITPVKHPDEKISLLDDYYNGGVEKRLSEKRLDRASSLILDWDLAEEAYKIATKNSTEKFIALKEYLELPVSLGLTLDKSSEITHNYKDFIKKHIEVIKEQDQTEQIKNNTKKLTRKYSIAEIERFKKLKIYDSKGRAITNILELGFRNVPNENYNGVWVLDDDDCLYPIEINFSKFSELKLWRDNLEGKEKKFYEAIFDKKYFEGIDLKDIDIDYADLKFSKKYFEQIEYNEEDYDNSDIKENELIDGEIPTKEYLSKLQDRLNENITKEEWQNTWIKIEATAELLDNIKNRRLKEKEVELKSELIKKLKAKVDNKKNKLRYVEPGSAEWTKIFGAELDISKIKKIREATAPKIDINKLNKGGYNISILS